MTVRKKGVGSEKYEVNSDEGQGFISGGSLRYRGIGGMMILIPSSNSDKVVHFLVVVD